MMRFIDPMIKNYSLRSTLYVILAKFVCSKFYVTLQYQIIINAYFPIMPLLFITLSFSKSFNLCFP